MNSQLFSAKRLTGGTAFLMSFALAKLFLHLATNAWGGYGIFRDELYYVACSRHLSAGYVDQPPLSIFLLAFSRLILGDSVFALRLIPAVAGAVVVYLTGLMARELGGGRLAEGLASLGSIVSLIYLGFDSIYSMNALDLLFWTWSAYILILIIKTKSTTYWIHLGLLLGLGLLNKISVLWLGFGIFAGLLLTPERRWLKTESPYLAGIIAFALFLPYIIWNATHNLAHLEFIRNASTGKYSGLTPITFLTGQLLLQNPATVPLWLGGLCWLLFSKEEKRFRLLAYVYLAAMLVLIVNGHSKSEYLSPTYSMLFAAGGVAFERWTVQQGRRWLRQIYPVLVASGLILAPFALPILPVESYIRYANALGVAPSTPEGKQLEKLPQFYADMFGWEEKAAAVSAVYHSLSKDEQSQCAIFGDNYGRCGAIDYYSGKYNLPKSIGRHNNYWIWGPRQYTGALVIILGGDLETKKAAFDSVVVAGTVSSKYCMPYENNLSIYVCRRLKVPLKEFWPRLKHFD